jgi:hypothetical protein
VYYVDEHCQKRNLPSTITKSCAFVITHRAYYFIHFSYSRREKVGQMTFLPSSSTSGSSLIICHNTVLSPSHRHPQLSPPSLLLYRVPLLWQLASTPASSKLLWRVPLLRWTPLLRAPLLRWAPLASTPSSMLARLGRAPPWPAGWLGVAPPPRPGAARGKGRGRTRGATL